MVSSFVFVNVLRFTVIVCSSVLLLVDIEVYVIN